MSITKNALRRDLVGVMLAALVVTTATACSSPIDEAISSINGAMKTISAQSTEWRTSLESLKTSLGNIESNADTQAGTALNQTTDDVDTLLTNSVQFAGGELNKAIDHLSDEARCEVSFFTDSIQAELAHLKSYLQSWKSNHAAKLVPLAHKTCWVDPSVAYLYADGGNWGVNTDNMRDRGRTIYIDGYSFRSGDSLPRVDLMDGTTVVRSHVLTPRYVDGYQLALDLPASFASIPDGATLALHWPDDPSGVDSTTIGLQKTGQAMLSITHIDWNPYPTGTIVAGHDQVWPIVTVQNTGSAESVPATSLSWAAGDGWTSGVVTVPALNPGQTTPKPIPLGPHQYSNPGSYTAVVQLQGYQSVGQALVVEPAPKPEREYGDFPNDYTMQGNGFLGGGFGRDVIYGGNCDSDYVRTTYGLTVSAVSMYQGKPQATASIAWADKNNAHDCRVTVHYSIDRTGSKDPNYISVVVDIKEQGQ